MKGLVFGGCSFTWGQGLYYYSGLDTLKEPPPNQYIKEYLTGAHLRYMWAKRFPRIVANHFDTFEVVQKENGGSENGTIKFLKMIFDTDYDRGKLVHDRFSYSEIEYIIVQTSVAARNEFYFTYKGLEYQVNLVCLNVDPNANKFYNWMEENKIDFDYLMEVHTKKHFDLLKNDLVFYESKGIKTRIVCWQNEYLKFLLDDDFTSERFIKLNYENKEYDSISNLISENPYLEIDNDYESFENPPKDHHPSKKCHEIIAESIIKRLEEDIKNKI